MPPTLYMVIRVPKTDGTSSIVAVTGLAGHAYESWESRSRPLMWLRDFLPPDLYAQGYRVRLLTFGYNSALTDKTTTPSIQHYARALFDSLSSERESKNVCVCTQICANFG